MLDEPADSFLIRRGNDFKRDVLGLDAISILLYVHKTLQIC